MSKLQFIHLPSPNHDERGVPVDMLVLHYTGMPNIRLALERLRDPEAKVSAHYVIDEDGRMYNMVPEDRRAWHAGVSSWKGQTNINARSIGIEIVNPGHEFGYRPFPRLQMLSVINLSLDIFSRHSIHPTNVVGHSDVAPDRKEDPGELFDWAMLAKQGVGVWPETGSLPADGKMPDLTSVQARLKAYGYSVEPNGRNDDKTKKVIIAFQRHFRPKGLTGQWDAECEHILQCLQDRH